MRRHLLLKYKWNIKTIDQILPHKEDLNEFKGIEITQAGFSNHNEPEIDNIKKQKHPSTLKYKTMTANTDNKS